MEEVNAERMTYLIQLAKLKKVSLDEIMEDLQIKKPSASSLK